MRRLLLLSFFMPIASLATQTFDLGDLRSASTKLSAPTELRKQLAAHPDHHGALLRCKADKRWGLQDIESFFAAIPLALTNKQVKTFLVFAATYCPEFFGAHSAPFWVMKQMPDGTYRELLSGVEDKVKVLNTRTKGYRDLETQYGLDEKKIFRFNGQYYK